MAGCTGLEKEKENVDEEGSSSPGDDPCEAPHKYWTVAACYSTPLLTSNRPRHSISSDHSYNHREYSIQTDTAAKVKVLLRQMKRRTFLHEDDPPSHDHMPSRLLGRITQ
ncbi:hypothetical protein KQX54_007098 [Cotesia glomerata]|uniref:Uncharacterized protein n=1 Tax=Cotesia glomerata TaxID=32391 RepID=A0AAV7J6V5_COTGL|nr:hypothetical protein KQX54_007098 [Cotesia glomerata]